MSSYQRKDHYYKKAKEKGLPSRASFKVEEILQKYPLVRSGNWVLDLGAAPGGWTVMLSKVVGQSGRVLAIDLKPLKTGGLRNVHFLQADFESDEAKGWLAEQLQGKKLQVVFSDMSPKLSGIPFKDAFISYELGMMALKVAQQYLKAGGSFVAKMFPGKEFQDYLKTLRAVFQKVKVFEPKAIRKTSREVYVLGMQFKPAIIPDTISTPSLDPS